MRKVTMMAMACFAMSTMPSFAEQESCHGGSEVSSGAEEESKAKAHIAPAGNEARRRLSSPLEFREPKMND